MAGERDLGLQALQSGDVNGAIQQLEAACADGYDYQAHIYLGAAYSQANRTHDAITVLTRAVELQPDNAQARYNLGIAMERGGYPDQAATAYEQASTLQTDYPKAREALQRLRGGSMAQTSSPAAPPPSGVGPQPVHGAPPPYGAPTAQPTHASPPQYGAPIASQFGLSASASSPDPAPVYVTPASAQPQSHLPAAYGAPLTAPPQPYSPSPHGNQAPQQAGGDQGLASYGAAPGSAPQQQPLYGAPPSPYGAPPSPYGAPPSPYGAPAAQSPYAAQRPQTTYTPPSPVSNRGSVDNSGVGMAILLGVVGGAIGTALWVGIILATHYTSGYIGIAVGAIVGLLIKKGNGGGSTTGGVLASVITILSSIAGNAIAIAMLHASNSPAGSIGFSIAGIFIAYRIASRD